MPFLFRLFIQRSSSIHPFHSLFIFISFVLCQNSDDDAYVYVFPTMTIMWADIKATLLIRYTLKKLLIVGIPNAFWMLKSVLGGGWFMTCCKFIATRSLSIKRKVRKWRKWDGKLVQCKGVKHHFLLSILFFLSI